MEHAWAQHMLQLVTSTVDYLIKQRVVSVKELGHGEHSMETRHGDPVAALRPLSKYDQLLSRLGDRWCNIEIPDYVFDTHRYYC